MKQIRFTETKNLESGGEFLNAFDHPNFGFVANPGSSRNWGQASSVNGTPDSRTVQVVMRINFRSMRFCRFPFLRHIQGEDGLCRKLVWVRIE